MTKLTDKAGIFSLAQPLTRRGKQIRHLVESEPNRRAHRQFKVVADRPQELIDIMGS